jgi:hypothetical protein
MRGDGGARKRSPGMRLWWRRWRVDVLAGLLALAVTAVWLWMITSGPLGR